MISGIIVKGIAGFYYVDTGSEILECKARGVFKKKNIRPDVGDEVEVDTDDDTPVITLIKERTNVFARPPVANVDQFIVVTSFADPAPNYAIIDKFLVAAESAGIEILMCFNKKDLAPPEQAALVQEIYGPLYPLVFTEAEKSAGTDLLLPYLRDKKSALAGPSGVGKSTLLNALRHDTNAETGDISAKTKRGRHTTRHVELFKLEGGGMIFDTPGFTSFDVTDLDEDELPEMFPEFRPFLGRCRFNGCRHMDEPDCAVLKAVADGEVSRYRYDSYKNQILEIRQREKNKY